MPTSADQQYRFATSNAFQQDLPGIKGWEATPSLYFANDDGNLQFRRVTDFEGAQAIMINFTKKNFDDFWYFETNQDVRNSPESQYGSDGHFMTYGYAEETRDAANPTFPSGHASRTLSEGMYNYFAQGPDGGLSVERAAYELTLTAEQKAEYDSWVNVERYYAYKTQWPKVYGSPLRENDGGNGQILAELLTNGEIVKIEAVDLSEFDFSLFPVPQPGSEFKNCRFSGSSSLLRLLTEGAELNFTGSDMTNTNLSGGNNGVFNVVPGNTNLRDCDLSGSNLSNLDMSNLSIENTPKTFVGTDCNNVVNANAPAKLPGIYLIPILPKTLAGVILSNSHDISYANFTNVTASIGNHVLEISVYPTRMVGARFASVRGSINCTSSEDDWKLQPLFVDAEVNASGTNHYVCPYSDNSNFDMSNRTINGEAKIGNGVCALHTVRMVDGNNPQPTDGTTINANTTAGQFAGTTDDAVFPHVMDPRNPAQLLSADTDLVGEEGGGGDVVANYKTAKMVLPDFRPKESASAVPDYINVGGIKVQNNSETTTLYADELAELVGAIKIEEGARVNQDSGNSPPHLTRSAVVESPAWTTVEENIRTGTLENADEGAGDDDNDVSVPVHDANTYAAWKMRKQYLIEGESKQDKVNGRMMDIRHFIDEIRNVGADEVADLSADLTAIEIKKYLSFVPAYYGINPEHIAVNDRLVLRLRDAGDAPITGVVDLVLKINAVLPDDGVLVVEYDDMGLSEGVFSTFKTALVARDATDSFVSENQLQVDVYKQNPLHLIYDSVNVEIPKLVVSPAALIRVQKDSEGQDQTARNANDEYEAAEVEFDQLDKYQKILEDAEDVNEPLLAAAHIDHEGALQAIDDIEETDSKYVLADTAVLQGSATEYVFTNVSFTTGAEFKTLYTSALDASAPAGVRIFTDNTDATNVKPGLIDLATLVVHRLDNGSGDGTGITNETLNLEADATAMSDTLKEAMEQVVITGEGLSTDNITALGNAVPDLTTNDDPNTNADNTDHTAAKATIASIINEILKVFHRNLTAMVAIATTSADLASAKTAVEAAAETLAMASVNKAQVHVPLLDSTVVFVYSQHSSVTVNDFPFIDHKTFANDGLVGHGVQIEVTRADFEFEVDVDTLNVANPVSNDDQETFDAEVVKLLQAVPQPGLPENCEMIRVNEPSGHSYILIRSNMDLSILDEYFATDNLPNNIPDGHLDILQRSGVTGNTFAEALVALVNTDHKQYTINLRALDNCGLVRERDATSNSYPNWRLNADMVAIEYMANCNDNETAIIKADKLSVLLNSNVDKMVWKSGDSSTVGSNKVWLKASNPGAVDGWYAKGMSGVPSASTNDPGLMEISIICMLLIQMAALHKRAILLDQVQQLHFQILLAIKASR